MLSNHNPIILLVEDEIMLQFVFERQLSALNYKVARIVDNGSKAVQAVLDQHYDLVFMDVRLPGIDGMTATEHIRAAESESCKHTKIVGMTAFAERQRCLDSGMDDFLQKPVLLEQLKETIEKWLNPANLAMNQTVLSETTTISMEHFQKTAARLDSIQARLCSLRKQVGLDQSAN